MVRYIILFILIAIVAGCAGGGAPSGPDKAVEGVKTFAFVDGKVIDVTQGMFTVQVDLDLEKPGMNFNQRVAAKITEKAFLLENMKTRINGKESTVLEKRGNIYIFAGDTAGIAAGQIVKIFVPKKTLAISSFKALKNGKDEGELWMEDLTTAMVNTGQFNIVERSRLGSIMAELKLELSGLTDSNQASKVGKLLNADIILTGSLDDRGGYWATNLRVVNTATSVILTAINDKITYAELKPDMFRDTTPMNATFEDGKPSGWNVGYKEREGFRRESYIDDTQGANGTSKSMKTTFTILKRKGRMALANTKDRDLSRYKGVEFYAKADKRFNIKFRIIDENRDDGHAIDLFHTNVKLTKEWKKYKFAFTDLRYKGPRKGEAVPAMLKGDTVLSLDLIRDVMFFFSPTQTPPINGKPVMDGTFWVDEIKFY